MPYCHMAAVAVNGLRNIYGLMDIDLNSVVVLISVQCILQALE